jgi:hypothetical protein
MNNKNRYHSFWNTLILVMLAGTIVFFSRIFAYADNSKVSHFHTSDSTKAKPQPSSTIIQSGAEVPRNAIAGLIAYYPFNGNANDESGNGYNGVVHGSVTLIADRFGNPNSAYQFSGSGFIDLANTSGLNFATGGFSVCAWTSFTSVNDEAIVVKHNPCGINNGYGLGAGRYVRNAISFITPGGRCGGTDRINTPKAYNDGMWHFAVGTYDGTTSRLYVDGVYITSCSSPYGQKAIGDILVGRAGTCGMFHGKIDDIRIYNRSLSVSEIQSLYNDGGYHPINVSTDLSSGFSDLVDLRVVSSLPGQNPSGASMVTLEIKNKSDWWIDVDVFAHSGNNISIAKLLQPGDLANTTILVAKGNPTTLIISGLSDKTRLVNDINCLWVGALGAPANSVPNGLEWLRDQISGITADYLTTHPEVVVNALSDAGIESAQTTLTQFNAAQDFFGFVSQGLKIYGLAGEILNLPGRLRAMQQWNELTFKPTATLSIQ